VQAVAVAASIEQETLVAFAVENANVAEVEVVDVGGLESIVTEGLLAAAVTVHEAKAWLEPAVLATRTLKVCEPSETPVRLTGEVQATAVVLSREHVVVVAPEEVHAIVAIVADVDVGGCEVRVTVGTTTEDMARERLGAARCVR
jgi:hypothetical protein